MIPNPPLPQRLKIPTRMHNPRIPLIHPLDPLPRPGERRDVGRAHQALPDGVDAVVDMLHVVEVVVAVVDGGVCVPDFAAQGVLRYSLVGWFWGLDMGRGSTRQCNWWKTSSSMA